MSISKKPEALGTLEIDLDAVVAEALKAMDSSEDVRWSVGYALQELYWERIGQVQARLTATFEGRTK